VPGRKPVDAAIAAKLPPPGTAAPGGFAFSNDGRTLTYLKSEDYTLNRVLWNVAIERGAKPRIVARASDAGNTDANVSQAEALRRERQRQIQTGITQVVRAAKVDVRVIPLGGDLYLLRGDEGRLERLTRTEEPEIDPQLDAKGTRAAFVRDGELYVMDLESKRERKLTEGAKNGLTHGLAEFVAQEELDRSSGFWLSPDGSKIAYQETDERHIPLYTIAHEGGEKYSVETHRYPFTGAENALVRLGVISVADESASREATTRWLELEGPGKDVYLARVDWEDDDHLLIQLLDRDQKRLRLVRFDAKSGARTTLIEERSDDFVNLHDDLRVVPGTGEILWSSERTGFRHLELHERDGKLLRVLTAGAWLVDGQNSSRGHQGVAAVDAKRREVWFWSTRESPLETHLYRVSLDGGPVQRITRQRGTHLAFVAPDGNHFVDVYSSPRTPPVTTLCDRDGTVLAQLDDASGDPRIAALRLVPPELTELKNRDGVTLYGAYYAARSKRLGERAPLVVSVYGGPQVQRVERSWSLTADLSAQFLTERGYAVWKLDNRGSSRRGHAFEAAVYLNMGSVEVRDQVDGVRFVAASRPEVDTSRVGITGASYGGYMTLRCLTLAPEVFHAGVSVAPVTDWDGYDTAYTERYMGTPKDNAEGYRASSVLTHADNLCGRLLLIHGMIDENVHFRHTARLATHFIEAGKPFDLLPLPEARHGARRERDRVYVAERTDRFFSDALRARD
jgi:dipeptidyl-peptidase-4